MRRETPLCCDSHGPAGRSSLHAASRGIAIRRRQWRKAWALHRATVTEDSRGDPVRHWDMTAPDYVGEAGAASGVCWQVRSGAWTAQELGERASGGATFDLFSDVAIAPFDRCVFGGSVWEVRAVLPRSNHRHVVLEEVRKLDEG